MAPNWMHQAESASKINILSTLMIPVSRTYHAILGQRPIGWYSHNLSRQRGPQEVAEKSMDIQVKQLNQQAGGFCQCEFSDISVVPLTLVSPLIDLHFHLNPESLEP